MQVLECISLMRKRVSLEETRLTHRRLTRGNRCCGSAITARRCYRGTPPGPAPPMIATDLLIKSKGGFLSRVQWRHDDTLRVSCVRYWVESYDFG